MKILTVVVVLLGSRLRERIAIMYRGSGTGSLRICESAAWGVAHTLLTMWATVNGLVLLLDQLELSVTHGEEENRAWASAEVECGWSKVEAGCDFANFVHDRANEWWIRRTGVVELEGWFAVEK